MKKVLMVLILSLMVTGCGKLTEEEAKTTLLSTVKDAYKVVYATHGFGLAVYSDQTQEIEGTTWYLVGTDGYASTNYLKELAEKAFTAETKNNIVITIDEKYKDINEELYFTGYGACDLGYGIDGFDSTIESELTITKIKSKVIKFTYRDKEYTLEKDNENWKLTENIFSCK